jgi:multiple sugar transport system substrate-binding protein
MADTRLSRRQLLRIGALSAGAGILAACGGAAPAEPGAAAPTGAPAGDAPTSAPAEAGGAVTVSALNENWGEIYNNLMINISDDFTKANPDIAVEWDFNPDWTTKLTTLIAANTPPDSCIMRPGQLANLGAKGSLTDLGPLVQEAGLSRDDFVTPIYDSSVYDGKLYAIPGGADYVCMFYSKDVYRDAGLDPEKPPLTLDELLGHSKQILQKDANGDIQRMGYSPSAGHFVNWSFISGGKFYDPDNKKITANDPANVAVLEWMVNYVKELDVNKLAAFNQRPGTYEAGNAFSTKQAAHFFDGFWTFEALDQHSPDIDYGVAFWPTLKGTPDERKNYSISGWMYSLPTGAQHTDQAWKFVRYAFIDQAGKMGYLTLNGPCVKSQFQTWEDGMKQKLGNDNRMAPYLKVFTDTGAAAGNFFPIIPVQSFYNDELDRVYDLAVRGELTPQAALDEVTKNVQSELDKTLT